MEKAELDPMECFEFHRGIFEKWEHGEIAESWRDAAGILCIRYQSGKWWHYATDSTGKNIIFW